MNVQSRANTGTGSLADSSSFDVLFTEDTLLKLLVAVRGSSMPDDLKMSVRDLILEYSSQSVIDEQNVTKKQVIEILLPYKGDFSTLLTQTAQVVASNQQATPAQQVVKPLGVSRPVPVFTSPKVTSTPTPTPTSQIEEVQQSSHVVVAQTPVPATDEVQDAASVQDTAPADTTSVSHASKKQEETTVKPEPVTEDKHITEVKTVTEDMSAPEPKSEPASKPVPEPVADVQLKPKVEPEPKPEPERKVTVTSETTVPAAVVEDHLTRIKAIKALVNEKVGNPVNLIQEHGEVGREYMSALLDAMKRITGGGGGMDASMKRLEASYANVESALAGKPVTPATADEQPQPPPVQPTPPATKESVVLEQKPAPKQTSVEPVAEKEAPPEPQAVPDENSNPAAPPTESVSNDSKSQEQPKPKKASLLFTETDSAPGIPAVEKSPAENSDPVMTAVPAIKPNTQPTDLKPEPEPVEETVPALSAEPDSAPVIPAVSKKTQETNVPTTEDVSVSVPAPEVPTSMPAPAPTPVIKDVQEQKKVTVTSAEQTQPDQKTPSLAAGLSSLSKTLENKDKAAAAMPIASAKEAVAKSAASVSGDPLMAPEITAGLNQLLSEWKLFKRSGLFGTGDKGIEHPLYKTIKALPMAAVISGRFEDATPEVKQSITDYMNGWRYEQGVIHQINETFEHYLRRVIKHILKVQKESKAAAPRATV